MIDKMAESESGWVIEECKRRLGKDRHGAKAWMITARLLFPDSFRVQWDVFNLHYYQKDAEEAARALGELCSRFQEEPELDVFLLSLTEVVCGLRENVSDEDEEEKLKEELFKSFTPAVQKSVLHKCAAKFSNDFKRCQILVEMLKRFPDTIPKIGLEVLEILSKYFYDNPPSPLSSNAFHELLVFDVIPLVAASRDVLAEEVASHVEPHQTVQKMGYFCQWLEMMANFYVSAIAKATLCGQRGTILFSGRSGWEAVNNMLFTVANKCGWREISRSKLVGPKLTPCQRWGFFEKLPKGKDVAIGPFYVAVLLFFQMCWDYFVTVKGVGSDKEQDTYVLVAMTTADVSEDRPLKKRRLDMSSSVNFRTGNPHIDLHGRDFFQVAVNCWEFLHSNPTYREEFARLYKLWGAVEWEWFRTFEVDMSIIRGDVATAKATLLPLRVKLLKNAAGTSDKTIVRVLLQLMSCHIWEKDFESSGKLAQEVMTHLPQEIHRPTSGITNSAGSKGPSVMLLSCDQTQVIYFISRFALKVLKNNFLSGCEESPVLGQLMVLSQLDWPAEAKLLWQLLQSVQKKGNFVYPGLLSYITNISLLEELVHLINTDCLQTARLLSEMEPESQARKMVTRGVNREKQDELKDVVQLQIKRSKDPIESTLKSFLLSEDLCLQYTKSDSVSNS